MPQLKPETHLLNIETDKAAFQGTKSKLVLTQLAQAVATAVIWLHKLHYSPWFTSPGCQSPPQPMLPQSLSRASHTNWMQTETDTLFTITQPTWHADSPSSHGLYLQKTVL